MKEIICPRLSKITLVKLWVVPIHQCNGGTGSWQVVQGRGLKSNKTSIEKRNE